MAYTYYDVGKYIIEGEQQGETRAAYGKAVLKNLSVRLSGKYGKGWSVATLKNTKKFYSVYSEMTNSVCPIESKKAKHCLANSKHEAGNLNTQNTENICLPTKRTGRPRTSPIMLLPCHEITRSKALATAPHLNPPHVAHLSRSSTPKRTKKPPCAQQESQCARRLKERIARKGGLNVYLYLKYEYLL